MDKIAGKTLTLSDRFYIAPFCAQLNIVNNSQTSLYPKFNVRLNPGKHRKREIIFRR